MSKLKNMNEKKFVDHDTLVEDYVETLEKKNTKEKTKGDAKLLETFQKRKERRFRSAKHRGRRIKQAPFGLYSFCER